MKMNKLDLTTYGVEKMNQKEEIIVSGGTRIRYEDYGGRWAPGGFPSGSISPYREVAVPFETKVAVLWFGLGN